MAVRVGVLGTGRIGRMHASIVAQQLQDAELAIVYDADVGVAQRVGREFGVPVAGSVDEVLADPSVDAVAICTPTGLHADQVVAAAGAGKAIFCEKPVSLELGQVVRALNAVRDAGVPFLIGFNQRFDPGHGAVAAAVRDGRIGHPQLVRITSRDSEPPPVEYARGSGGIFLDMTIHDFDMARFVVGSEVLEVYAAGAVLISPELGAIDDFDTVVVTLVHENGCLTTIDGSRRAVYGYDQRVEAFGSAGVAVSENPQVNAAVVRDEHGSHGATLNFPFLDRYAMSYVAEWAEFVSAVRERRTPSVSVDDALPPVLIALAAGISIREHRPVSIAEIVKASCPASGQSALDFRA